MAGGTFTAEWAAVIGCSDMNGAAGALIARPIQTETVAQFEEVPVLWKNTAQVNRCNRSNRDLEEAAQKTDEEIKASCNSDKSIPPL